MPKILALAGRHHGAFRSSLSALIGFRAVGSTCIRHVSSTKNCVYSAEPVRDDFGSGTRGSRVEAHVVDKGGAVVLGFPTGEETVFSLFHAPWLWSNDPTFVHPTSGQRLRSPGEYPGTQIVSATLVSSLDEDESPVGSVKPHPPPPTGCSHPIGTVYSSPFVANHSPLHLRVAWESTGGLSHPVSYYDIDWLRQWRYDEEALQRRRESSETRKQHAIRRFTNEDDGLVHVDYAALTSDDSNGDARFELLQAIVRDGAALVQNAPLVSSGPSVPVATVGRTLAGSLSHGALYGDLFDVLSMPYAHNIAYTNLPIRPHQDLAYYESMPGLQLLHCVSNHGIIGGESVLVDAMAAADQLRHVVPHHFETLAKCAATFVKQREGADMIYLRPHIVLREEGSSANLIDREVVAVNWSPPFEGPACMPSHFVQDYYAAYAAFERMIDNSLPPERNDNVLTPELVKTLREYAEEYTWERRLEPGEMLVFNNRRLLHGRRGFSLQKGQSNDSEIRRHLVGAYTNIDETLNQYRLLLRERQDRHNSCVRNVGNGSSGIL